MYAVHHLNNDANERERICDRTTTTVKTSSYRFTAGKTHILSIILTGHDAWFATPSRCEHTNNEWKQIYWLNEECWKVQAFSTISWRSGWRVLNCLSFVHQTTMDREWSVQSDIGYIYLSALLVLISRWIYKIYNREKTKSPVLGVRQVLCDRNHVHVPKPNHIPNCRKNWYALPAGIDHYIHI